MSNLNISSYIGKNEGDTLSATQWNSVFTDIQTKVNEIITKTSNSCFYVNGVVTSPLTLTVWAFTIMVKMDKKTRVRICLFIASKL